MIVYLKFTCNGVHLFVVTPHDLVKKWATLRNRGLEEI